MAGQNLNLKTTDDVKRYINEADPKHVKVGFFDMDGVFRGGEIHCQVQVSLGRDGGYSFCDAVLGGLGGTLRTSCMTTPNSPVGTPVFLTPAYVFFLNRGGMILPFENDTIFFSSEFTGRAEEICPRAVLRRGGFTAR